MPLFLPDDLETHLTRLLRNRIAALTWDYFAINLDAAAADPRATATAEEVHAFFNNLDQRDPCAAAARAVAAPAPSQRLANTHTANEAMAYFFALLRLDPEALATFIRDQLDAQHLTNGSRADIGTLGKLNVRERRRRNRAYRRKIADGHRDLEGAVVVLAEGDSWFQFPRLYVVAPIKDLVYYLLRDPKYAVRTLAAGGDWLAAIAEEDQLLSELADTEPDVLLLSGGGNDLVGDGRLGQMVTLRPSGPLPARLQRLSAKRSADAPSDLDLARYRNGLRFVDERFLDFLNQYFLVYFHLVYQLHHGSGPQDLLVVTQGYDYVLPQARNRGGLFKRLVNRFAGNGDWLHEPLEAAGIGAPDDQRDVLYAMIYEFNEMLITLARYSDFTRLRHLDVRGFARKGDWYDELHLRSDKNEELARNYQELITQFRSPYRTEPLPRVWPVRSDAVAARA